MKKLFFKLFLLLFLCNSAWIAGIFNPVHAEESGLNASSATSERELLILFTHDLHSYFLPHRILTEDGRPLQQGGYAKLAYLINEQKRLYRDKTLLVDAGDFSMGTLFHTAFMNEAFELRLMGKMGYDVTTFGNHDLDFHPEGLARMLRSARARGGQLPAIVASNIVLSRNNQGDAMLKKPFDDYPVREYIVIEKNGLRIGIFGIMGTDAVENAPFTKPVTFSDPIETSKRLVDVLKNKEKADIVLCLSHSGTSADPSRSEDEILAKSVPQIDMIISGHSHTILTKPKIVGKTMIVSCGRYGRYLGMLKIVCQTKGAVRLESYALKNVSSDIPEEKEIASDISDYKKIVNQKFLVPYNLAYDEVIAESGYSMETLSSAYKNPRELGLGNLITDAYRYAVRQAEGENYRHIHFALQPLGVIRDSLRKGKITMADVFQVLSLGIGPDRVAGYPLVSFYISGKEIKDILEVHTTIAPMKKDDAYLQVSGVKFTYNPKRVWFDRVTSVYVQEENGIFQPLDPDKLYRACANLYTAALIDYVSSASYGFIKVRPKDQSGNPLPDLESSIVHVNKSAELKEWLALTLYLRSFNEQGSSGLPQIPERYGKPEGRYLAQPSLNPVKLFSGGNIVTNLFLLTVLVLLMICACLLYFVIRKIRRSHTQ